MAKVIENLQRFRKIEEATAQKDDPAPGMSRMLSRVCDAIALPSWAQRAGRAMAMQTAFSRALPPTTTPARAAPPHNLIVYLLDEILEMARQSSEAAQAIADAIKKKLEHRSPVVKFKVRVGCSICLPGCSSCQYTRRITDPIDCTRVRRRCRRCA